MSKIIIAIPRGRIIKELKTILMKTTFAPEVEMFDDKSRKLTFRKVDLFKIFFFIVGQEVVKINKNEFMFALLRVWRPRKWCQDQP